jgi:hypothetical protein
MILDNPDWAKDVIRSHSDISMISDEISSYDSLISDLERKRGNYVKRIGDVDDDTAALISAEIRKLAPQIEEAKIRRAAVANRRDNLKKIESTLDRICNQMATVDQLTYEEKRIILDKFGVRAYVWPVSAPQRYRIEMAYDLDAWYASDPEIGGNWKALAALPSFANNTGFDRCRWPSVRCAGM